MSEFVDPDDLKVQRDSDDQPIAQDAEAGAFGKVRVRPMSYGDVQAHFGDGADVDVGPAAMAALFNEFYVKPEFDLDEDDVEDFKPLAPRDLLMALLDVSGIDADVMMDEAGSAQVAVEGNT